MQMSIMKVNTMNLSNIHTDFQVMIPNKATHTKASNTTFILNNSNTMKAMSNTITLKVMKTIEISSNLRIILSKCNSQTNLPSNMTTVLDIESMNKAEASAESIWWNKIFYIQTKKLVFKLIPKFHI